MANNIWLVAELTIAQGKTETFKERMQAFIEMVHSNEPDTLVFECHLNDRELSYFIYNVFRSCSEIMYCNYDLCDASCE